ncbi:GNAT family N-acetyltransferase [Chloroflexota bacterium]
MMKDNRKQVKIVELNQININDINSMDNAFKVKSRIIPHIKDGIFGYTINEVPGFYTKSYPDDEFDYSTYIGNPDRAAFLAYVNDKATGQITLRRNWNTFAWIEDIRVGSKYRRMDIGTRLMEAAVGWTKKTDMLGIMLETQDTNVPACLFYQKFGFTLGGVDKMLYGGPKHSVETALLWYFVF